MPSTWTFMGCLLTSQSTQLQSSCGGPSHYVGNAILLVRVASRLFKQAALNSLSACAIVRPTTSRLARLGVSMRHLCYFLLIATIVVGIGTICHAQSTDELRLSIARDVMDEIAHDQLALV